MPSPDEVKSKPQHSQEMLGLVKDCLVAIQSSQEEILQHLKETSHHVSKAACPTSPTIQYDSDEYMYDADVEPYAADVESYDADADVEPYDADVEPYDADVEPYDADVEPYAADVEPYGSDVQFGAESAIPTDGQQQHQAAALSTFADNEFQYIMDISSELEGEATPLGHSTGALAPMELFETPILVPSVAETPVPPSIPTLELNEEYPLLSPSWASVLLSHFSAPPPAPTDDLWLPSIDFSPLLPAQLPATQPRPRLPAGPAATQPRPRLPAGPAATQTRPRLPAGPAATQPRPRLPAGPAATQPRPRLPAGPAATQPRPRLPVGHPATKPQPPSASKPRPPVTQPRPSHIAPSANEQYRPQIQPRPRPVALSSGQHPAPRPPGHFSPQRSVDSIMGRFTCERDAGRLAVHLATEYFFGEAVMEDSTPMGLGVCKVYAVNEPST